MLDFRCLSDGFTLVSVTTANRGCKWWSLNQSLRDPTAHNSLIRMMTVMNDTMIHKGTNTPRTDPDCMRAAPRLILFGLIMMVLLARANPLLGQAFTDPGFEGYSVSAGSVLQPVSGPWTFANDAAVVRPFSPNVSNGTNTWSATFAPIEGQQYASTYAGLDSLRQTVTFASAGNYRISAFAAAPSGSITLPSAGGGTFPLVSSEFTFTLGGASIGNLNAIDPGSSWTLFSADFSISAPGDYQLGIRNTKIAPYFINYDNFAVQPVPEPSVVALVLLGGLLALPLKLKRKHKAD